MFTVSPFLIYNAYTDNNTVILNVVCCVELRQTRKHPARLLVSTRLRLVYVTGNRPRTARNLNQTIQC